jgi:hypothetical protein
MLVNLIVGEDCVLRLENLHIAKALDSVDADICPNFRESKDCVVLESRMSTVPPAVCFDWQMLKVKSVKASKA